MPTKAPDKVDHSWIEGVKAAVYGGEKTGKTRFATSFPKPMLFIATEEGTKSICLGKTKKESIPGIDLYTLRGFRNKAYEGKVDWVRIESGMQLDLVTTGILRLYKSVCLDHGTGLNNMLLKEVLGLEHIPIRKSWGMADRKEYGACGMQWCERVRNIFDICDKEGLNALVLCHEKTFKPSESDEGSDVMVAHVGSALGDATAKWLHGAADYVMQAFVRQQMEVVSQELIEGQGPVEMTQATGKVEYCMRIGKHPTYATGFRSLLDNDDLPPSIVNPTWDKMADLIVGNKPK